MRWNLKIRKMNKKTWKLSPRVRKGKQRKPKCNQKEQKGSQREPTAAKKDPKGARREPKGNQRESKGSQREPKASQREPKASQRTTKMPKQIYARKKVPKRARPTLRNGTILEPFQWAKNLKNYWFFNGFMPFRDFGKSWKQKTVWGVNFGGTWSILDAIFNFRGSQNPHFSRVCYRRVTCRYTYPMRKHKERVVWGKVQCKIGKQRVAKTILTRSAGSFRGPGADFGAHWILKGVPKSTIFENNLKQMRKRRSRKRLWKNMICWSIFDAKIRGLKS